VINQYDVETETMMSLISALTFKGTETCSQVRRMIRERVQMFQCGRQQVSQWIRSELQRYDDQLDIRWDYLNQEFIIERYGRKSRAWIPIMEWKDNLDNRIFDLLRDGDMWRFSSSEAYLEAKRARSAKIREDNRNKANERLLDAIDSLSNREAEEFMEVEQAFKTGEKVRFMGQDDKSFTRMQEGSKKAAAKGEVFDPSKQKITYGKTFSRIAEANKL
jgi:hypothetical protein